MVSEAIRERTELTEESLLNELKQEEAKHNEQYEAQAKAHQQEYEAQAEIHKQEYDAQMQKANEGAEPPAAPSPEPIQPKSTNPIHAGARKISQLGQSLGGPGSVAIALLIGLLVHLADRFIWGFEITTFSIIINTVVAFYMLLAMFGEGFASGTINSYLIWLLTASIAGGQYAKYGLSQSTFGQYGFFIIAIGMLILLPRIPYLLSKAASKIFGGQESEPSSMHPRAYLIVGITFLLSIGGFDAVRGMIGLETQYYWLVSTVMWPPWIMMILFCNKYFPNPGSPFIKNIVVGTLIVLWILTIMQQFPHMMTVNLENRLAEVGASTEGAKKQLDTLKGAWANTFCSAKEWWYGFKKSTISRGKEDEKIDDVFGRCVAGVLGEEYLPPEEQSGEDIDIASVDEQMVKDVRLSIPNVDAVTFSKKGGFAFKSELSLTNMHERTEIPVDIKCGIIVDEKDIKGAPVFEEDVISFSADMLNVKQNKRIICDELSPYYIDTKTGSSAFIESIFRASRHPSHSESGVYLIYEENLNEIYRNELRRNPSLAGLSDNELLLKIPDFKQTLETDFAKTRGVPKPFNRGDFVQISVEPETDNGFIKTIDKDGKNEFVIIIKLKNLIENGEVLKTDGVFKADLLMEEWLEPVENECPPISKPGVERDSDGLVRYELDIQTFSNNAQYWCKLGVNMIKITSLGLKDSLNTIQLSRIYGELLTDYKIRTEEKIMSEDVIYGCGMGSAGICPLVMPFARLSNVPPENQYIKKYYSNNKKEPYDGIGLPLPAGTEIVAAGDGEVVHVCNSECGRFGPKYAIVEHAHLGFATLYAHLQNVNVNNAQKDVKKGETVIGTSGTWDEIDQFALHIDDNSDGDREYFNNMPGDAFNERITMGFSEYNPACYMPWNMYKNWFKKDLCDNCGSRFTYDSETKNCGG